MERKNSRKCIAIQQKKESTQIRRESRVQYTREVWRVLSPLLVGITPLCQLVFPAGHNFARGFECIYLNLDTTNLFPPSPTHIYVSFPVYINIYAYSVPCTGFSRRRKAIYTDTYQFIFLCTESVYEVVHTDCGRVFALFRSYWERAPETTIFLSFFPNSFRHGRHFYEAHACSCTKKARQRIFFFFILCYIPLGEDKRQV